MASASVQSQIDTAISSVYKYKGQCTNAELASKTKTAGDVWEITDTGTYAAGTDVVCDGTNWSAMTGHLHVNVVDSLDSTSTQDALSANMGKALDTGKQDKLTAGTNITIDALNVISANSGGSPKFVAHNTANLSKFIADVENNNQLKKVLHDCIIIQSQSLTNYGESNIIAVLIKDMTFTKETGLRNYRIMRDGVGLPPGNTLPIRCTFIQSWGSAYCFRYEDFNTSITTTFDSANQTCSSVFSYNNPSSFVVNGYIMYWDDIDFSS